MKFALCLTAGLLLGSFSPAFAGTPLTVQMDQSQLMMLEADPGTIIVGNPSIADVSINGRQLFFHGHSFGETNIMIFDTNGKKVADYDITVSKDTANELSLYLGNATNGAGRHTYSCAPNCEQNMMVGDDSGAFQRLVNDNRTKNDYATGVKTSDLGGKASEAVVGAK